MKYIVITRSLQTDFQWEHDANTIANILIDLLSLDIPENIKDDYKHSFILYFSRYIADNYVRIDDNPQIIRNSLRYLMEEINQAANKTLDEEQNFVINYKDEEFDLLFNLIETTIEQYYLFNKQELIEKVDFLKQDYGQNLVFLNSSRFYTNLTSKFYNHGCDVFYSRYNNKNEIISEFIEHHCANGEEYELILV